ncbi:hypothetical protein [uncultured Planococcus sp.]|uniref:hypothetical protein n=1 Tax=uncultured Planococcus sp. TaxID=337815 RepID=UPI00262AF99D|nr:hypothetical protein [uncultured Planococcus sp.]
MDERKIKDAVNSIEMSKAIENRLKTKCFDPNREKSRQINFKKWGSVASAVGILLLLLINLPFISNYGNSQMATFTITAYAADNTGHELLKEKTTFDLATLERIGVLTSISGDGDNLIFTNVSLNVSGENIDSIFYEINKGTFIEDVILSKEEVANWDKLVLEKINYLTNAPNSEIFQGIKYIGNTFTVKYSEQQKYKYSLAIPPHNSLEEEILINVTVTYKDGTSEQQDIVVNHESGSISLVLD